MGRIKPFTPTAFLLTVDLPRVCSGRVTAPVPLLNRYLDPTLAFGDTFGTLAVSIQFGLAYCIPRFGLGRLTDVDEDQGVI